MCNQKISMKQSFISCSCRVGCCQPRSQLQGSQDNGACSATKCLTCQVLCTKVRELVEKWNPQTWNGDVWTVINKAENLQPLNFPVYWRKPIFWGNQSFSAQKPFSDCTWYSSLAHTLRIPPQPCLIAWQPKVRVIAKNIPDREVQGQLQEMAYKPKELKELANLY